MSADGPVIYRLIIDWDGEPVNVTGRHMDSPEECAEEARRRWPGRTFFIDRLYPADAFGYRVDDPLAESLTPCPHCDRGPRMKPLV